MLLRTKYRCLQKMNHTFDSGLSCSGQCGIEHWHQEVCSNTTRPDFLVPTSDQTANPFFSKRRLTQNADRATRGFMSPHPFAMEGAWNSELSAEQNNCMTHHPGSTVVSEAQKDGEMQNVETNSYHDDEKNMEGDEEEVNGEDDNDEWEAEEKEADDDDERLQLRLASAWQRKARRLFDDLSTRVKCVVFTDCPHILDLAMEGIGWGLNLLQEQANESEAPRLFNPAVIRSKLPERVTQAREWFSHHSVHFVAADTPIGTLLDEGARRTHPIPVLSAGTTEHDLIPSSVLDTVFNLFDSKLNLPKFEPTESSSNPGVPDNRTAQSNTSESIVIESAMNSGLQTPSHHPPRDRSWRYNSANWDDFRDFLAA
ncbi:unnamed protein product [Echinostoma caproni]|uniref:Uncharacterized protein n=1 Tax=Echinostoma caproni TaxID=27848 RepID=A0A3P8F1B0_9TREM|nr:unnamed protein product [Echinostoma caproni]